jgi:Mg2+ and Co2+ transporter CorA
MNFTQMPGLSAPYGFSVIIGGMVALLVGLLWGFKRAGWY